MNTEIRLLGQALNAFSRGDAYAAICAFRRLAKRHPCRIDYHLALADLLQDRDMFAPAIHHYRKALGLLTRGEARWPRDLPHQDRLTEAAILCSLGAAFGGSGDLSEAESCFRRSVALEPTARHLVALAELLELTGHREEALPLLHQAVEDDTRHVEAHYRLGCWHLWTDPVRAAEALGRVVELDEDHVGALSALGFLASARGEDRAAEAYFERAIRTGKASALPHVYRGHLLLDRGDEKGAEAAYREAMKVSPGDPHPIFALGDLHHRADRTQAARRAYRDALQLDPQCADALIRLALLEAEEGQRDEAIDLLRRGLELAPEHPWHREARDVLARLEAGGAFDPDAAADEGVDEEGADRDGARKIG